MNEHLLHFENNRLIIVEDVPRNPRTTLTVDIDLPRGAALDHLQIKGTIVRCIPIEMDDQMFHLIELELLKEDDQTRSILQAYMTYLDREKRLDDFIERFSAIIQNPEDQRPDKQKTIGKAVREYLLARIKDFPFN